MSGAQHDPIAKNSYAVFTKRDPVIGVLIVRGEIQEWVQYPVQRARKLYEDLKAALKEAGETEL